MTGRIETRLAELGIELPDAASPVANYAPFVVDGALAHVSGQLPMLGGELRYFGAVGDDLAPEDGYQAARLCAINLLAQLKAACEGDLDRVRQVVKLGGFVYCAPYFTALSDVINGASDLMVKVFGDTGRHARFAVGTAMLPMGAAVEVDGLFRIG